MLGIGLRARLTDGLRTAAFILDGRSRKRATEAVARASTVESFYAVARQELGVGSSQNLAEIADFLAFARAYEPERICEIGVQDGGTSFLLSQGLPTCNLMISLDLYVRNKRKLRSLVPSNTHIHFVQGSSHAPQVLSRVMSLLRGAPLDLLFIDGDHSLRGVRQDFVSYRELVRPGGLIAFHDIVEDQLMRTGVPSTAYVGGVPILWHQISGLFPSVEFIERSDQEGRGIGVVLHDPAVSVAHLQP